MRHQLTCLCYGFLQRNRQACLFCALVLLNILIVLLVWPVLRPKKPAVYGILYLGEGVESSGSADDLERRTFILHSSSIMGHALNELAAIGRRARLRNEEMWLIERLSVEPLEQPSYVRVTLAEGTPAEQIVILNAVFRAYVGFFQEREQRALQGKLANDRGKIMKEVTDKVYLQPPKLRSTREEHNRLVNQFVGDRLGQLKAARKQEIRAAMGKSPAVVEWAHAP